MTATAIETFDIKHANNWQKHKIQASKSHQIEAASTINNLVVRSRHGKSIKLANTDSPLIEFASCSYLGLDLDPRLINASSNNMIESGVNFAVSRTRLRMQQFDDLESLLSTVLCGSHVTVFSTLHIVHMGFLPLLSSGELPNYPINKNGPLFIFDKVSHASMQMQLSFLKSVGEVKRVDFQNEGVIEDLFALAAKNQQTPISISDSVISMGGVAPVRKLLSLADKYQGYAYFDDAHGTSIFGKHGCGYVLDVLDVHFHPRLILTASLSKGFGSNGAVIALRSEEDSAYIKQFCEPYIFCNPPAISTINASIASAKIHLSDEINQLQKKLWNNVALFDALIDGEPINGNSKMPIRGIFIGDEETAIKITIQLQGRGFFVLAAMYPTVEKGKSILRIAISAAHEKKHIIELCKALNELKSVFIKGGDRYDIALSSL